jgi:hypothetical protein
VLSSADGDSVFFLCCGSQPKSTDHVISALFSDKFVEKVKDGDFRIVVGVVIKWVYHPFMEGVSKKWTEDSIEAWTLIRD